MSSRKNTVIRLGLIALGVGLLFSPAVEGNTSWLEAATPTQSPTMDGYLVVGSDYSRGEVHRPNGSYVEFAVGPGNKCYVEDHNLPLEGYPREWSPGFSMSTTAPNVDLDTCRSAIAERLGAGVLPRERK